jgi:hypothetical protein
MAFDNNNNNNNNNKDEDKQLNEDLTKYNTTDVPPDTADFLDEEDPKEEDSND